MFWSALAFEIIGNKRDGIEVLILIVSAIGQLRRKKSVYSVEVGFIFKRFGRRQKIIKFSSLCQSRGFKRFPILDFSLLVQLSR